ncbi:MAG: hypothetical protein KDC61_11705 [Saprospiraceae bacterium]|nr:hypothetical protein [Saprospiraceae bacterium]
MQTKHLFLIFLFALGFGFSAKAQDYHSAIGLRLGYPASISYKHFISEPGAIEAFLGFRSYRYYRWMNIGGLYEHHMPITGADGLNWYVGGGASLFFWNYKDNFPDNEDGNTSFGVLGAIGLDYKFANAPLNVSVDWLPVFFVNGYGNGFAGGYGALSVPYTIN